MPGKELTKEIWFYGKNYKMNLYTQLESKAKIQPTFTAIEWENGSLSYFQFLKLASNIGSALTGRFKLEKVKYGGRNPHQIKEISHLREDDRWLMMGEGRPSDMVWLYLSPINN